MIARTAYRLLIIAIIIITAIDLRAQSFNPVYNFKHLNVQNGLSQNIVYHFLQDSRGYIWIGTHNGITLFDGMRAINFLHNEQDKTSLSGNFITNILEDSAKQIWVGNETGIDLYNRIDNTFSHFGVDRPGGSKDNTYCVLLGFTSAHELWFLDTKTKSVRSLDTKTKTTSYIADLNAYNALFYKGDRVGDYHIWSSYDKGSIHQVYRHNKLIKQQTFFSGKNGGINKPELEVSHVLQQNDTTVWLSTNDGLARLNPVTSKYLVFKTWQNQIVKEFRYAALSPKGQLWLASGAGGVYTFDINNNQFTNNFSNSKLDPFSICSDNIVSLYFDRSDNIWCGSYGNGASYTNLENTFFENHISKNEIQAWNGNNNISWIGTDARQNRWCIFTDMPGFWMLDKNFKILKNQIPLLKNGQSFNGFISKLLFNSGDDAWCATSKGLFKYNISTNRMSPVYYDLINEEVQGSIWIKDIIRLNDGSVIFSTYAGLYHVINQSGKPLVESITFLNPGTYNGLGPLFQDKKNYIYVKSLGDSFYILKPTGDGKFFELIKSIRFVPEINHYFNENGDSIIYLGTPDGLYHINNNNFQIEKEAFNSQLPFLNVRSVFKKDKKFWVFGEKGLYFFDERNKKGRTFTVEDGLPSNEFSMSALIFDSYERCITGTANGLVSFFPGHLHDSINPPRAQLTGVYINDRVSSSAPNSNEIKQIDLTSKENTFAFDYSAIAFQHAADCSFEYKLGGYDENWIKGGVAHYTRYSKIPPGDYTFDLRVIDAWGKVSPFAKTLEIRVAKAFWQTTVFKAAALVFILMIGWRLSRWYFSNKIRKQKLVFEKQQAIERERTRIATDMHDDLGAGLSRIKYLSQSILNKKIEDENIKTELKKITTFSDEMSEKMGEIVWALNEKNDTLADLIAYTRSYTAEYLANHNIQCEANTPLHLPGTFITGEMRRNIFLSVKECLHNIVKHAAATKVYFSVELDDDIQIVIHDNGKGIDWNNQRAFSNGIQNINMRMNEINGKVKFLNEQGTKVLLTIPINL